MHCYNFWRGAKFKETTDSFPDAALEKDKILIIINDLIKNQVFRVTFAGGEPFLFRETAIEEIETAKKAGLERSINSTV